MQTDQNEYEKDPLNVIDLYAREASVAAPPIDYGALKMFQLVSILVVLAEKIAEDGFEWSIID